MVARQSRYQRIECTHTKVVDRMSNSLYLFRSYLLKSRDFPSFQLFYFLSLLPAFYYIRAFFILMYIYAELFLQHVSPLFLCHCRSTDDHSPGRTNFYDRVSTSQSGNRSSETSTDFIRRNNYHSNEIRGRQRDRHLRNNNPYSLDR